MTTMTDDDITKAQKLIADTFGKPDLEEVFIAAALDPKTGWAVALETVQACRRAAAILDDPYFGSQAALCALGLSVAIESQKPSPEVIQVAKAHFLASLMSRLRALTDLYRGLSLLPSNDLTRAMTRAALELSASIMLGADPRWKLDPHHALVRTHRLGERMLALIDEELAK